MDKDYFMNGGIPNPWSSSGLINCTSDQSFIDSGDKFPHFDSSFSSMPPSAAASEAFILRELIGKLGGGGIGSSSPFPPPPPPAIPFSGVNNTNDSGYPTPPPPLHSLSGDPGFAERAAKFSCFGSRSFNGRTPPPFDGVEPGCRSAANPSAVGMNHLHRVSSSPCLNPQPAPENKNSRQPQVANSNDDSSVSEQIPSGETGSKTSNELNSRKRKVVSRAKDRSNPAKVDENGNTKRSKGDENGGKIEEEEEELEEEKEKQKSADKKAPEPPKDYIHVRARRGQATDSHSLAERVRREKISERMKLLQDLVPGCNKVTGKALMLDEIINYVQSLQRQVEFLSMKLSSVNPGLDFNMENLLSKDHNNATVTQQMYPLDSSSPAFYHHQNVQQLHNNNSNNNNNNNNADISVDPLHLDATLCRNLGIQLSSVDRFSHETLPQFPGFSEDDLQSIVQMGFAQNPANFSVQNQTSNMKVER